MRYTLLFSIFLFVIFTGCKKDSAGDGPTLKFKNVTSTELHSGDMVQFTLSFDGGSGDDTITVEKIVPYCVGSSFVQSYPIPAYPVSKDQNGEVTVTYGYNPSDPAYQNIAPQCQQNDTAVFRFFIRDSKQHTSDTVSSPTIILYYQ
jgi:hypothetical protein